MPADRNIIETAAEAGKFATLLTAAKAAGLADVLASDGPFTVFAPTDEAFAKVADGIVESLLKPENKQQLVDLLKYHVVAGRVYSDDAIKAKSAPTLLGNPVSINVTDGKARINWSNLVNTDLDARNGVIHAIDAVLMPPQKKVSATTVLQDAVARGSAMFNAGHHQACADLYHQTLTGLMSDSVNDSMKHQMSAVLTSAQSQDCPTQRAWTLRHGIDRMYTQLSRAHRR